MSSQTETPTETEPGIDEEEKQELKREIKQAIVEDRELLGELVKREFLKFAKETADKIEGYPSRRDVLTAGGAAGVYALSLPFLAGEAAAAPQGDLGTTTTPWTNAYVTNVEHPGGDLTLTGQNGNERLRLLSSVTQLRDEEGQNILEGYGSTHTRLHAYADQSLKLFDNEQSADAVQYDTDASTGTLELTNADLDASGNNVGGVSVLTLPPSGAGQLKLGERTSDPGTVTDSAVLYCFDDGSGNQSVKVVFSDGTTKEIVNDS